MPGRTRVVIVGGGFGGLIAARSLARAAVDLTLVDRQNHHVFQPLLYQVAMAGLSPADIAQPIRAVVHRQSNTTVLLDEVQGFELESRRVELAHGRTLAYDYLIVAAGAETNYFGHETWAQSALGLKDIDDAIEIRRRVLLALEAAESEDDAVRKRQLLTFVVIGGGPTGVELAGALSELARYVLARDFRRVRADEVRVLLLEGTERILTSFPEALSASAVRQLAALGAETRTGARVVDIRADGVYLEGGSFIPSVTVLWAAGVKPSRLAAELGTPRDRAGRVLVEPDLSLPGRPEVFVIGDMAAFLHSPAESPYAGKPLPGVSPVAMQQARAVADCLRADSAGRPRKRFRYLDKGNMATIGRKAAVADMGRLRFSGFPAWLAWLVVHLFFLIGFRNRFVVLFQWTWSYLTYQRGARLITGHRLEPGPPRSSSVT